MDTISKDPLYLLLKRCICSKNICRMPLLSDIWAVQRFFSGTSQVSCEGTSRTSTRCLLLTPCPFRMQENVKCISNFMACWGIPSLQNSLLQCGAGEQSWVQTAQAWILLTLPASTVTVNSYSLCLCIVDTEKVLPKSPWIPLTNLVCPSSHCDILFSFHPLPFRRSSWTPGATLLKLRKPEVLRVYYAWASTVSGASVSKSSDVDSMQGNSAVWLTSGASAPYQAEAEIWPLSGYFPTLVSNTYFHMEHFLSFFFFSYNKLFILE